MDGVLRQYFGESSLPTPQFSRPIAILACDLFTVETLWLKRIYVLFFVSLERRRVEYVAVISNPDGGWMTQQARNCFGRPFLAQLLPV